MDQNIRYNTNLIIIPVWYLDSLVFNQYNSPSTNSRDMTLGQHVLNKLKNYCLININQEDPIEDIVIRDV